MTRTFFDALPELMNNAYEPMVDVRHDLHAHPELSFKEHRTSGVIRQRLVELGWELASCPTETGAVATLHGAQPGNRVMLRADIPLMRNVISRIGQLTKASCTPAVTTCTPRLC